MARQRVLKPGFNDDDDMIEITLEGRLFYALLWGWLDKQALIEESPIALRSKIFPREEIDITRVQGWIDELTRPGPSGRPRLVRVKWRGRSLLYAPTLKRHSRIFADEPVSYKVPEAVLKAAREAMNIWIDEAGEPVDPPVDAPPGEAPSTSPPASHPSPPPDPRGSHAPPTNPHDSSSASSSASVSPSVVASAPASAGPAAVDNCADAGDNSRSAVESAEVIHREAAKGKASQDAARDGPLAGLPAGEATKILDLNSRIPQLRKEKSG